MVFASYFNLPTMNPTRLLFLLAFLAFACGALHAGDDDAEIRRAVNAMMDDYTNFFMTGRADLIADRIYFAPFVTIPGEGPSAWMTKAQIRENLAKTFEALAADGY